MSNPDDDPVIRQFRDQITDNDLRIVDLLNERLRLVDGLWRYKVEHDVETYSPERENQMLALLTHANTGPLSPEALTRVYGEIVTVTKDEARRLGGES